MTRNILVLIAAAALPFAGCAAGSDDTVADARDFAEVHDDSGADADADADADEGPDVEAEADEGPEAEADAGADLPAEAEAEAGADVDADDGGATCATIAEVRAMTDGAVSTKLCEVLVTYVYPSGYFVQEGPTGPAIWIFESASWVADVAVGDVVTIPVTSLTTYHGSKEVYAHGAVTVHSSGNPIAGDLQDLSAGTLPAEDLEAELVQVTGATVTALAGLDATISYGTAAAAALRVSDATGLCVGAVVDLSAPVLEWDATWRIQSFRTADFSRIDNTACAGGGRTPVPGDLLLNEFLADPPPDLAGDANCDGVRDGGSAQDEFIELVNVSADRLSLAGVTISDTTGVRHNFSSGTSLDAGKVIVVFGGGTPSCTTWGADVQVVTASGGALGLNNGGDTITVADGAGASAIVLQQYTFGSEGGHDTSLTLNPDLNDTDATPAGVGGFVAHNVANPALAFSPGTRIDGTAF